MEKDNINKTHIENSGHTPGYTNYVLVWLGLVALTSITVTIAGMNLGSFTLVVAMGIAAVKSALVITIFMHIKYEELLFKVFIGISAVTLLTIFVLTFMDYANR